MALSKAQKNQESMERDMPTLDDAEDKDATIAASFLTQAFLSPEGTQGLEAALSSPEPAKGVAMIVVQVIEMAQQSSQETEIPLSPRVWLAQGGALDDASEDLMMVAEEAGVPLPEGFIAQVKQEVSNLLKRRGEALQQEGQGSGGAPPMEQPMAGPPPPGGPAPIPGDM